MILCWATLIDTLGHIQPVGHGLDTPALKGAARVSATSSLSWSGSLFLNFPKSVEGGGGGDVEKRKGGEREDHSGKQSSESCGPVRKVVG